MRLPFFGKKPGQEVSRPEDLAGGAAAFWDAQPAGTGFYWASLPDVRESINVQVTGVPWLFPTHAFKVLFAFRPLRRGISIGCGTGALERELRYLRVCEEVEGYDVSPESVRAAGENARNEGVDGVRYTVADCDRLAPPPESADAVFFHHSLHHIADPDALLGRLRRALRPGGLLFVDDYVGPSRDEWTDAHLVHAREEHARLDPALRTGTVYPPLDWRDPSEMIRSSRIAPAIEGLFEVLHHRPYWGNLLFPLLCAVDGTEIARPERRELVRGLVEREKELVARGAFTAPLFAVYVARKPAG